MRTTLPAPSRLLFLIPACCFLLPLCASPARARTLGALFRGVGDLEGGPVSSRLYAVSGDGNVAVGSSSVALGAEAAVWQRGVGELVGMGQLATTGSSIVSEAQGASADGSVIVGYARSDLGASEAFRWTEKTGMVGLGDLPGGTFQSLGLDVSNDGAVVIGKGIPAVPSSPGEAFRWTEATGMVGLGDLPGGVFNSRGVGVSGDGEIVVGFSKDEIAVATFRWTEATGMVRLDSLPGGFDFSEPRGISNDGHVIVGFSDSADADPGEEFTEACYWVDGAAPVGLGDLPGGTFDGRALATNADGSVIVGTSDAGGAEDEAFIWTQAGGMRPLRELLETDYGADLGSWQLVEARGISDDGHTIVGWGINPDGNPEGFIVEIPTVARLWDEQLLDMIRLDYPAPTVHSRNLLHLSAAMWDVWAAYDPDARGFYHDEKVSLSSVRAGRGGVPTALDVRAARDKGISYAAMRILEHRFNALKSSPGAAMAAETAFDDLMLQLGYDPEFTATSGDVDPAAELGNRVAATVIAHGSGDDANEDDPNSPYSDDTYTPVNPTMNVDLPGATQPVMVGEPAPDLNDYNRWQPLALDFLVLQNGIIVGESEQVFLGSRWGQVTPFALVRDSEEDVYDDPGPPPYLGCAVYPCASDTDFKEAITEVIRFSGWLDPDDGAFIDISPGAKGNNPLGTDDGNGHPLNPYTGEPYAPNVVRRGDWGRIIAEFWADGPDSETPPGHWNTLANYVSDHPLLAKRLGGSGPILGPLEWDVKLYLAVNGAVFDAAIAAWDAKRKYDYVRPITQIRYMGGRGQSSDPLGPSYDPLGLPLVPGLIEVVTAESAMPGGRHENVKDKELQFVEVEPGIFDWIVVELPEAAIGQIAIRTWPGQPDDPETEYSGVEWIRAIDWLPYQRETFVTPPFASYTSGHSTFSRAGAEVLTRFTGNSYFPGGLGTYTAPQDTFLAFEIGPTETIELQWASYNDASDEAGISRLWGGIHVRADDFNGRIMGSQIGIDAFNKALSYYSVPEPAMALRWGAALAALALLRTSAVGRRVGRSRPADAPR